MDALSDKIKFPSEIEEFYFSTNSLILSKYKNGQISEKTADETMRINRWWAHFLRLQYNPLSDYEIRKNKDELKIYDADDKCIFVISYRKYQIPFYSKNAQNDEFYAILGKRHFCGKDRGDSCFLQILDQIDEQLDEESLQAATAEIKSRTKS